MLAIGAEAEFLCKAARLAVRYVNLEVTLGQTAMLEWMESNLA